MSITSVANAADPLPSWNKGPANKAMDSKLNFKEKQSFDDATRNMLHIWT